MAAKLLCVALLVGLAQVAVCNKVTEKPGINHLKEIQKHATDFADSMNKQFNALLKVKGTDELAKVMVENNKIVMTKISELADNLKTQIDGVGAQAKIVLKNASEKLGQTVTEMKKKNELIETKAKEMGEILQKGIHSAIEETQKVAKDLSVNTENLDSEVAKNIKKFYEQFIATAEIVKTRLSELAATPAKTIK